MRKKTVLEEDLKWVAEKISNMEMKNCGILVTGATGLIGSLLIKSMLMANRLYNTNIKCVAVVRNMEKAKLIFGDFYDDGNLVFYRNDVEDVREPVDFIVHTASVTSSKQFVTQPVETIEFTYSGTKSILEFARKKKIHSMVYLSSMEAYGIVNCAQRYVKEEDLGYIDILNVRSSYSEGKRIAECLCASYKSEYGVPVKIARLAQTFGPGISEEENRVFAQFARSAINGKNIVLHTKGESIGNYCYTRDCIWGLLTILLKGADGEAYTVVNEENSTSIKDMALMVSEAFGGGNVEVIFDIPENQLLYGYAPDVKMYLSAEKLRNLGWNPEINLKNSYGRMIEDMRENINVT